MLPSASQALCQVIMAEFSGAYHLTLWSEAYRIKDRRFAGASGGASSIPAVINPP
jgi:hypothetical protein